MSRVRPAGAKATADSLKKIGQRIKQAWHEIDSKNPRDAKWLTQLRRDLNRHGEFFDLEPTKAGKNTVRIAVGIDKDKNTVRIQLPPRPKKRDEYDYLDDEELGRAVIFGCGK